MLIGYARVSTQDQNLDLQVDALKAAGCERLFSDKTSGAKVERLGFDEALAFARDHHGDTLVVWKLDRLGRSLPHLIEAVRNLGNLDDRGIGFRSLKESIDTTTSTGRLVFHVFAALAEFERNVIRERTGAGPAAARARGRKGGRPKSLDEARRRQALTLYEDKANTIDEICRTLWIGRTTLYRYVGKAKG